MSEKPLTRITARVPDDVATIISRRAEAADMTESALIRQYLIMAVGIEATGSMLSALRGLRDSARNSYVSRDELTRQLELVAKIFTK